MSEQPASIPSSPAEQLEAIHAMLRSGHRGVRLERHSFVLWGGAGALLLIATPWLFTEARFPAVWRRAAVELVFLAALLALAVAADFRITRRVLRRRDESLTFVQRQIGKIWLLLIGLGLMATFGMHFHGGGGMVYVLWLLLLGIGLFTHGLFSEQILGWLGGVVIALGAGALALGLPTEATRWLAVLVFGAGLPSLGIFLRLLDRWSAPLRLAWVLAWVGVVTTTAFAAYAASI